MSKLQAIQGFFSRVLHTLLQNDRLIVTNFFCQTEYLLISA